MECKFCNPGETGLIYETNTWKVFLVSTQGYIGQCVIILNRHCEYPEKLTDAEWLDLRHVLNTMSTAIRKAFGATHFNESCLMNDFYKSSSPNPHVHVHLRPRYRTPVSILGKTFIDKEFGHHYDNHASNVLTKEESDYIYDKIHEVLNN